MIAIIDVSQDKAFSNTVARLLNTSPHSTEVIKLKDGETSIKIKENVKEKDAYIFQSYTPPIGERFYELLNAISAARTAKNITIVMPYCFGMRGEKQIDQQPIQTGVVARTLKAMGVNRIITIGLHADETEKIFSEAGIKMEHLTFNHLAASFIIKTADKENTIVLASPDEGGARRVRETQNIVAKSSTLKTNIAIGEKRRPEDDKTEILNIKGDVKGKTVFLYDDIGDTLGTIHESVRAIKERGAKEAYIIIIHPVLGQGFEPRLRDLCNDAFVKEIVFGNTIPLKAAHEKIRTIPLEPLFAEAIRAYKNPARQRV